MSVEVKINGIPLSVMNIVRRSDIAGVGHYDWEYYEHNTYGDSTLQKGYVDHEIDTGAATLVKRCFDDLVRLKATR